MKKSIALIFAASTLFLAGCCTTHHITKWEYKTSTDYGVQDDARLSKLGKDGWILVSCTFAPKSQTQTSQDEYHYVFKRPTK
jgi:hypothetical protein